MVSHLSIFTTVQHSHGTSPWCAVYGMQDMDKEHRRPVGGNRSEAYENHEKVGYVWLVVHLWLVVQNNFSFCFECFLEELVVYFLSHIICGSNFPRPNII